MTAAFMFAGAGLVTLIASMLVQQWALARHVPRDLPPAVLAVADRLPGTGVGKSAGECGSAMFPLGSPFAARKSPSRQQ